MKVLLVVCKEDVNNSVPCFNYQFPIGLGYIASALNNAGHTVYGLNLNHETGKTEELLSFFLSIHDDVEVVGTGNYALRYWETKEVFDVLNKQFPQVISVLGGPLITSEPQVVFEDIQPTYGVLDEGDESIVELLDVLEQDGKLSDVDGIIYRDITSNELVITNKREPPENLDRVCFPELDLFEYEKYLSHLACNTVSLWGRFDYPRLYTLVAGRSCPYSCTFCYHENNRYRVRSVDNIMEELYDVIPRYRINRLIILDEIFSLDKDRLLCFCERMKELREGLSWDLFWFAQMRPNFVDRDILNAMKEAGCDRVGYGFESFSDVVLKSMHKGLTSKDILKAYFLTKEVGLSVHANFIFGDSAETLDTASETLGFWLNETEGDVNLSFIMPYPRSVMYQRCLDRGLIADRLSFLKDLKSKGVLNMTDDLSDVEFQNLVDRVTRLKNKHRLFVIPWFKKRDATGRYSFSCVCPSCGREQVYGNLDFEGGQWSDFGLMCRYCNRVFNVVGMLKLLYLRNRVWLDKVRGLFAR